MQETVWEIRKENEPTIQLNIGKYTSLYNEHETHEEEILSYIHNFFQPRSTLKEAMTIKDIINEDMLMPRTYQSFLLSHPVIEQEHQLAASSMMYKKLLRDLQTNIETDSYLASINVLLEDLLAKHQKELPLAVKPYDYKQFIKQLTFEYDYQKDYSRLINRLLELLPKIVQEMNAQTNNKTILIYLHPEANLSAKEQQKFRKLLLSLPVEILIVLTESTQFISNDLTAMNYLRGNKQMLSKQVKETLVLDAPLNYTQEEIMASLERILKHYSQVFEISPKISNHRLADMMLFDAVDIYTGIAFMKLNNHHYQLDMQWDKVPHALKAYIDSLS